MKKRWKSPVAWGALAALAGLIAKMWFNIEIPGWDMIVNAAITAAIAFGIFNNPTDKGGF